MVDANEHELNLPHDGYLKLYQMEKPVLRGFDLIAVDEAQDLNPCTFDIVCRQSVPVVMVGDAAQAIYSFRGSTNALTLFEADERLPLTRSFRFGRGIAQLANALLGHFRHGFDQPLVGAGAPQRTRFTVDTGKAFAVIARTNAVVFEEAVAFLDLNRRFHFVGGTEGYKLEKALDAYRLWVGERGLMRDPYLRSFGSFDELVGLAEASEEPELRQLVRVVCDYGHQIPRLIEDIRSRHTDVPKHAWADFDGILLLHRPQVQGPGVRAGLARRRLHALLRGRARTGARPGGAGGGQHPVRGADPGTRGDPAERVLRRLAAPQATAAGLKG
jgi:F-box protein 18 (helicase)